MLIIHGRALGAPIFLRHVPLLILVLVVIPGMYLGTMVMMLTWVGELFLEDIIQNHY
jgi:hypothetical protein